MVSHVITACIFCFVCATHSPCASHAAVGSPTPRPHHDPANQNALPAAADGGAWPAAGGAAPRPAPLHSAAAFDGDFVRRIFAEYGDGETMTVDGFGRLLERLELLGVAGRLTAAEDKTDRLGGGSDDAAGTKCLDKDNLTKLITKRSTEHESSINHTAFEDMCPALLYSIIGTTCNPSVEQDDYKDFVINEDTSTQLVWMYSILAVVLISVCGVLALVIIPVMQKRFYKPLIQFLVALAVGTLAGDALLHLLPHAMSPSHAHSHEGGGAHGDSHDENTWKGFVAMLGLTFFFAMEKFIALVGKWRKTKQQHTYDKLDIIGNKDEKTSMLTNEHTHVKVINELQSALEKSDTQCMDKYNPSPYCYKDIMNVPDSNVIESDRTATTMLELGSNSDVQSMKKSRSPTIETKADQSMSDYAQDLLNMEAKGMLAYPDHTEDYTVILREHKSDHHGHSHKHGHVHAAPQNFSSVAWMVIFGDGLHNFTDGMAIGAAFSSGAASGFSTTVAVFCHELPHELGDFAMLLKAGMTIKQALFYNILSSVLCVLGNVFGLWLGNTEYASSWVFAAAAGMFIYIALVDMIPELSSAHEDEGNLWQCLLHLSGLVGGFGIMTFIALYEHDLKHLFHDPE